jgi:hypothetical protein
MPHVAHVLAQPHVQQCRENVNGQSAVSLDDRLSSRWAFCIDMSTSFFDAPKVLLDQHSGHNKRRGKSDSADAKLTLEQAFRLRPGLAPTVTGIPELELGNLKYVDRDAWAWLVDWSMEICGFVRSQFSWCLVLLGS